jgi:DNA-binding LytR/AlgR family response regulator
MTNKKIKCVILEDEKHTSRLLVDYVSKIEQLELLGVFISPVEFLNYTRINEVQLIYLDIQMPEMTGIDFLKFNTINAEIIITTAYSEYALKGYELNVTDYLLKPIELHRFIQASQKAIEKLSLKKHSNSQETTEHLFLKVNNKIVKITIDDIVYIKSDWNYIHLFTSSDKYMTLSTMKDIEKKISGYKFIRIHKSYIINMKYFEFLEGNQVQVNGTKLQVSRNYKKQLTELISL